MTKLEKNRLDELPVIGYWSALGGVEVKELEEGIEAYVICIANAWSGKRSYHRVKVRYTHSKDLRPYITIDGTNLYLDECLRSSI